MYEYSMLTQVFRVSWDDGTARSHAEELNRAAHEWFPEMSRTLDQAPGGPWEIVSHDMLRTEDGLLITMLARRETTRLS